MYRKVERQVPNGRWPVGFRTNMDRLSQLVGLNCAERCILEFAVMLHNEHLLDKAADQLGELTSAKVIEVIAISMRLKKN